MDHALQSTALALVEEALDAHIEKPTATLREGFGTMHLLLAAIGNELAQNEADQDADRLLDALVQLAAVAAHAAIAHVLPAMEKEAS